MDENQSQQYGQQPQYDQQGQYGQNPQYNQQPQYNPQYGQPVRAVVHDAIPDSNHSKAIAALVCGILGLVFCWVPVLGLTVCIIGLIAGIVSLVKNNPGKGMAIAGVITAAIGLLASVYITVLWIVLLPYV